MLNKLLQYIRGDNNLLALVRGAGLMYMAGGISIIITFIQQLTTANLIGAGLYGQFATVVSTTMLIFLLVDFRTWEATTKLVSRAFANENYEEAKSITTWLILFDMVFGLIGVACVMVLSKSIAQYLLKTPETASIIVIYAIMIPFRLFSMGVPTALIRLYDRFDWLAVKSVVYAISRLILISGAAFLGFGLQGIIIGAIVGEIFNALLMGGMVFQLLRRDDRFSGVFNLKRPEHIRDMLLLMRDLWFGATLKGLQLETFVPILAFLTTPEQVGIYRVGVDIVGMLNRLIEPISIVIQPTLIKIYESETTQDFIRYLKQVTVLLSSIIIPLMLGIILFGDLILNRMMPEFPNLGQITSILVVGYGIGAIMVWVRAAIVATNLIRIHNIISFASTVYIITGLIILADDGAIGAAIIMSSFLSLHMIISGFIIAVKLRKSKFTH